MPRTTGADASGEIPERWHFKREVQLGHIVSTLVLALSAGFYITKMDQRIALLEEQSRVQRERDQRQDTDIQRAQNELTARLERMDNKLDQLILRRSQDK